MGCAFGIILLSNPWPDRLMKGSPWRSVWSVARGYGTWINYSVTSVKDRRSDYDTLPLICSMLSGFIMLHFLLIVHKNCHERWVSVREVCSWPSLLQGSPCCVWSLCGLCGVRFVSCLTGACLDAVSIVLWAHWSWLSIVPALVCAICVPICPYMLVGGLKMWLNIFETVFFFQVGHIIGQLWCLRS